MEKIKIYFQETRPQFLVLSVILVLIGWGTALTLQHSFLLINSLLAFIGLILLHISVNVLNDYFDYKSGIDLTTNRTPFNGGSGILLSGKMKPSEALVIGIISFILAIPIGLYFIKIVGIKIVPIFTLGAIFVLFYTPILTKVGFGIPEISAGLGLGALPVYGIYVVLTGNYNMEAIIYAIPSFFLVFDLLLLNEIPDLESDRRGGRKTLPILIGPQKAFNLYVVIGSISYLWIVSWVIAGKLPTLSLLSLITIPLFLKIAKNGLKKYNEGKFIEIQAVNIPFVIVTQALFAIGIVLNYLAG